MNGPPFFSDYINACVSEINPSTVRSANTYLSRYFQRHLLQKAISVFKWKLPETWDRTYFLYTLYMTGFVGVMETDKFGVIPQHCGLMGRGVMYQPTHILVSNPLFDRQYELQIGRECSVLRLCPDWGGIFDIVCEYAELMSLTSELCSINTINSRLSWVFLAENKTAAESQKKLYDQLTSGNPAAFVDKHLFNEDGTPSWVMFNQDVGKNYITAQGLEVLRKLECLFADKIGIPSNLATNKKERTISAEVEANDTETYLAPSLWLEELQAGCEVTNRLFGTKISVDWRVTPETVQKGGGENADDA